VVGDMTRRLLTTALPVALDLAVRQVPTFTDIRVTFQTILKSMDLRQILQKAVQKIWQGMRMKAFTNVLNSQRNTRCFLTLLAQRHGVSAWRIEE
jgi:hypothetical protein